MLSIGSIIPLNWLPLAAAADLPAGQRQMPIGESFHTIATLIRVSPRRLMSAHAVKIDDSRIKRGR